jgi:hypothetical protein
MIPFILGAIGLIAYGLSEKETEQKSSKKSYSKGLPAKIKWDKKNNIYGKSVGSKFLKILKKEFDSLYNDAHDGYYYQANTQLKGGVMTYTLRSIHSKTKMAKGGGVKEFNYELKIQPAYKYKNIANSWLKDNPKDSLKYKLAVLIIREKKDPDKILGIKSDSTYGRLLRSLEKAKGESKHEMSWRTENYSLSEAEKWTNESLGEMFYLYAVTKKMANGGGVGGEQITKVAEAIFSANEKNGKIKISTKASQTLGGLKYLIADLNSEHIASMIFEANQKNGKIKTQMGEKTYGQLLALISHSKSNRLDNYKMAQGGAVDMYSKFDFNKSGNYFATINNKNYEIIYRDDKSQMYDLFENNKKIKSNKNVRNLMKFPKMANGGGVKQKFYNEQFGIGKSKYVVNFYDGVKTNKDGSAFLDIKIFKNIPDKNKFINELKSKGYTNKQFAKGGAIDSQIDALYEKSGFINDDYNWESKLLEMLQDSSMEAYQIYQKLTAKQKKDVLEELFEMENDMGADGDEDIETSKENLTMFLSDSKNGKKY